MSNININMNGVALGDSLKWNPVTNEWGVTQIPYDTSVPDNEPNFVIALTGQSNSQGANSYYHASNKMDQPHERILGWNPTANAWELADMNTESLGYSWCKPIGNQCFAFHFARRLVEAYPEIRVGIINFGLGGQPIARWATYAEGEEYYAYNIQRVVDANQLYPDFNFFQGDIFYMHASIINNAFASLKFKKNIDVICYHQGEADGYGVDSAYYLNSLKKVIEQYRSLNSCCPTTPFIVGETTGASLGVDVNWEERNVELRNLNKDSDPYTKCVYCGDLETSHGQYNNGDTIHYSANAQRKMGTLYFRSYRSIFDFDG